MGRAKGEREVKGRENEMATEHKRGKEGAE
jgi:hypothetical protein